MKLPILKMEFRTPLHLGGEGHSVEIIEKCAHSDTLFSAICHAWLKMHGAEDLKSMLDAFIDAGREGVEPPFSLSSAFPYVASEKTSKQPMFYFPTPHMRPPLPEGMEPPVPVKDVNWVSKALFERWITYYELESAVDVPPEWDQLEERQELLGQAMVTEVRPRITRDELSGGSQLYFFGMQRFAKRSGLYCFIRWREDTREQFEPKLKAAINLLSDIGLGGERSSGYGTFKPRWCSLDLKLPDQAENTNGLISLSLWYPNEKDMERPYSNVSLEQYQLVHRAGWSASPLLKKAYRRKVVRMFAEGSTFRRTKLDPTQPAPPPFLRRDITGCLVDVTPEDLIKDGGHRVYRYGFAFTLPVWCPQ